MLAQLTLACACLVLDDDVAGTLRCLDIAFCLGGPTAVYAECVELLDQPGAVAERSEPPPPPFVATSSTATPEAQAPCSPRTPPPN